MSNLSLRDMIANIVSDEGLEHDSEFGRQRAYEKADSIIERLGLVACQTCDEGRWPTKLVAGEECVCHLGDGERSCKAHVDWVNHSDCRLGFVPSEKTIERAAKARYELYEAQFEYFHQRFHGPWAWADLPAAPKAKWMADSRAALLEHFAAFGGR